MKFRSLAAAGATLVALFALVNLINPTRPFHPDTAAAPEPGSARAPASQQAPPAPADSHARFCENVYKSVCQKRGETRDPTGTVHPDVDGELEALRTYEEILHQNPSLTPEQADEELVKSIYTPKRVARIESAFRWVRHSLEAYIEKQPETVFNRAEKRLLKKRLRETALQLPLPAKNYGDEPDLFTKNDVYYERLLDGTKRMRVGGAYVLTAKSWFNILFTFAHEFGHAIDPCELRAIHSAIPAYDRLGACMLHHGIIAARRTRSECGENDQLSEAFADWLAVQVMGDALGTFATEFRGPQLINAATNAVRDLCEQDEGPDEADEELHPSPQVRIERIFGRNPTIRQILGCGPAPNAMEYCTFEWTNPQPQLPKRTQQ